MRTCIITGANAGIGRHAAAQLAQKGFRVIMACRNMEQAESICAHIRESSGCNQIFARRVDLSLVVDTVRFADEFIQEFGVLDVLINNAADFDLSRKRPMMTPEGNETQFTTNLLSPFVLMKRLQPLLADAHDARIINIASKGLVVFPKMKFHCDHIHGEAPYSPANTYYQTKLGLLMISLAWERYYTQTNISVYAIRVPSVKVDLARYPNLSSLQKIVYRMKGYFSLAPDLMAGVYAALATDKQYVGFYYDEKLREVRCNANAYDIEMQDTLWQICEQAAVTALRAKTHIDSVDKMSYASNAIS